MRRLPTYEVHRRCREFISGETIELRGNTHASQRLECAGANVGSFVDHLEACRNCQFHELRRTQAVLVLDRIVLKPPFSLPILKKIGKGDRLVEERIMVVAADVMHGQAPRLEHPETFFH